MVLVFSKMLLEWYRHCHWRETQTALHLEQLTLYEMVPPTSIVLAATATSWQTVDSNSSTDFSRSNIWTNKTCCTHETYCFHCVKLEMLSITKHCSNLKLQPTVNLWPVCFLADVICWTVRRIIVIALFTGPVHAPNWNLIRLVPP